NTDIITLYRWIGPLAGYPAACKIRFPVIRHIGPQEQVISIHINLEAANAQGSCYNRSRAKGVSELRVLQAQIGPVVHMTVTVAISAGLRVPARHLGLCISIVHAPVSSLDSVCQIPSAQAGKIYPS